MKVGLYLSDITGAFDKVFKDFLLAELHSLGVADQFLDFLNSYLSPRLGYVAVEGVFSEVLDLADMCFQGTVLGPALWNAFFHDITLPAEYEGGTAAMFADDLNMFKQFHRDTSNDDIKAELEKTRQHVHAWGKRNRVTFDPAKEGLAIIHPLRGEGDDFKFLGCLFDVKLQMQKAVDRIVNQARPKIKAILRTKAYYDLPSLIQQYKTHVWGILEHHNGAILHSSETVLAKIDRMQRSFVSELLLTEEDAFVMYNFGPPRLRRDIGILGFLHKRVLEQCHPGVIHLLPLTAPAWHNKQIESNLDKCILRHGMYWRSLWGYIHIYNRLPQAFIDLNTVSEFQSALTHLARCRCNRGDGLWRDSFHSESEIWKTRLTMT